LFSFPIFNINEEREPMKTGRQQRPTAFLFVPAKALRPTLVLIFTF
jgi:hypothetical protein